MTRIGGFEVILGLYRNSREENGSYYLGFRFRGLM